MTEYCFCLPIVLRSNPPYSYKDFLLNFFNSRAFKVRILLKNGHFSAVFSSYGTSLSECIFKSYECPVKEELRTVTELGQKITFLYVYYAKTRQKIADFDLFKNPSFKIENLLAGSWPHVCPCYPSFRIILTFFH